MRRIACVLVAFVLACSAVGTTVVSGIARASACKICVTAVQLGGGQPETEGYDAVVLHNNSSSNVTSIQLRYVNANGVLSEASSVNVGSIKAGQYRLLVSDELAASNPDADLLGAMSLSSAGGSLVVGRSTSGTIYDIVSWGETVYGAGGTPVDVSGGTFFERVRPDGELQDTGDSQADFVVSSGQCSGVAINEIQPYVTDVSGAPIDAWVELVGVGEPGGSCVLLTSVGAAYDLPAEILPQDGALALIAGEETETGTLPLHLGELRGAVWLADGWSFGQEGVLYSPVDAADYTALVRDQSMALVDGIWRRTFSPTPGAPNEYLAQAPSPEEVSTACETVHITELLPNPAGEDTDKEWVEIQNKTAEFVPIGFCQVVIGGTAYGFLEDDLLAPNEYRSYSFFYDDSSRPKSVSLRNSGDNEIVWRRSVGGQAEPLQRLQYSNAPEGSSWSRYDTGWRWDDTPTPNLDNSSLPEERDIVPIERAVPDPAPNGPTTDRVEADPGAQRADIPVTITEILPNPASPLADDTDEFVELYNSGSEAVALRGYRLQAGSNFTYNYTFEDEVISPHGYLTVTSGDTPISLSNKAGRVRLTTASGEVVAQTDPYESADAGAAWAWIQGKWQWTHKPTPSAANVLTAAPAKVKKSKKSGSRAKSKKAAKKKSSKTKAAKTAAASKGSGSDDGADADVVPPVHTSILVGVGALAVLYAAYEYRHDIANRIHQLRTNRGLRRASRRSA